MKIAAISDLHGEYEKIKFFPHADVFVFAGDCAPGDMATLPEICKFAKWVHSLPYNHKIIIPGNHDMPLWHDQNLGQSLYNGLHYLVDRTTTINYLVDRTTTINGIKFHGSPWTPLFGPYGFMKPDEDLEQIWDNIPENTDVLITHGPPFGVLDANYSGTRCGSKTLIKRLDDIGIPYNIFGHIHEARGRFAPRCGAKCYNVAYDPNQPELNIIEV
jgi:Icc-related predicted phosphoesterase